MEEQQRSQQLLPDRNGKNPLPLMPVFAPQVSEQKTDDWDLRQLLAMIRRRAIVISSVAIAVCGTVWFSTLSQKAIYEGKFGLLVEPVTGESELTGLSQLPGAAPRQQGLDYDTQILVMRSPELVAPIIQQISTRYPEVNYGSLLGNLRISRLQETKILEISYKDSDPQKIQFVTEQLAKGYVKYSAQQRQNSLGQGIHFVDFQLPQLRTRVNNLQIQLQRFREQYNFIDPESKAAMAFQKASNLESQRLEIQKQLAEIRRYYAALQGKSGKELALQAQSSNFNEPAQSQLTTEPVINSSSNGAVPSQLSTQPTTTNSLNGTASTQSNTQSPTSSATNNLTSQNRSGTAAVQNEGSLYQSLVAQLRDLDTQIALELSRYQEDSPAIQVLRQKRKNLLPVLQKEAERTLSNKLMEVNNQIKGLETQAVKIIQAENSINRQIKQMPELARRYTDLQRELIIATQSLNRFLEKRESLQVEAAQKEMPWQLIAPPQLPRIPVSPNVQRNLMMGAIAGLLAGIAAALLVEKLDNGFHSPDELKEVTKLALLGVIPFHKNLGSNPTEGETNPREQNSRSRRSRNSYGYSYFPFLEAFRSLYTNIGFLSSDTPVHSLVISSSVHAEGKSTVATYLAQAAAAMGRRVLLVDADLRLPQIHRILKLSNETGLSNAISTNVPVADLIQRSPAWENLFILTAGTIPPDPTKLLSSHKMRNIMEQLRQQFDLVIYDTPPMLGLADASLIAPHTAGIAVVTRMDKTDRTAIVQTLEQLKLSRTQILGAICNGVKDYKATTSYYYYYYQPRTQTAGQEGS